MGKKSGPPAPDYTAIANTQAQTSAENTAAQTAANRPNQYTPFGSSTWSSSAGTDPATGKPITNWSQTTSLDPTLQNALNSQLNMQQGRSDIANSLMGNVQQSLGTPMDYSGFQSLSQSPQATTTNPYSFGGGGQIQSGLDFSGLPSVGDAAGTRANAENATYNSLTSRLDPQYAQAQSKLETDLANRGISMNSDAYSRAMDNFNRSKTDAYQQANNQAVLTGGTAAQQDYTQNMGIRQQQASELQNQGAFGNAAQAQMYGQGSQTAAQNFGQQLQANNQNYSQQTQSANYQNQLRQQQIAEALQQRGMSLNDINSLMSGQQVSNPQFASFGQAGQAQTPDLLGAANAQYGAAQNSQNASNAFGGQMLGAAGSIASMFFSDRRLKKIIKRVGTHPRGFGIYRMRYIGERGERIGVIAQEVRKIAPELVASFNGVLKVNYAAL